MKNLIQLSLAILIIGLTVSCSSTKSTVNSVESSKEISIPEGKALLYVIRPQFMGFAINFNVKVNGEYIGKTNGKRFLYTYLDPGSHLITSKAENTAELELVAESGRTYFVEQLPQMGVIMARNKLVVLDEATGREKIRKCKLSSDNVQL